MKHIHSYIKCIEESSNEGMLIKNNILTGFSGEKFIGALQRFSQQLDPNKECYLEIGVFQGLSLLSVAMTFKKGKAFGIDNFSQFDKDNKNFSIVKKRIKKLELDNVSIINKDFELALENLSTEIGDKKVGVYFVDGPHDYRSQLMCLLLAEPYLSDNALIIVDDSNYEHVRQANRDFLVSHSNYKLLFEAYSFTHPHNLSEKEQFENKKTWWNGINIIVKDKDNILPKCFPPVKLSKTLYYNQHLNDSAKFPEAIPTALSLLNAIKPFRPIRAVNRLIKLRKKINRLQPEFIGEFSSRNTFSKNLTTYNLIKPL